MPIFLHSQQPGTLFITTLTISSSKLLDSFKMLQELFIPSLFFVQTQYHDQKFVTDMYVPILRHKFELSHTHTHLRHFI